MADPIRDLVRIQAELGALPPQPRAIYTSHSVPWGRVFRQWTARGDLIVWVSRGEFEDMPRVRPAEIAKLFDVPSRLVCPLAIWGIPVYHT